MIAVLAGCSSTPAASAQELAAQACDDARTVTPVASPDDDLYEFTQEESGEWVDALAGAADAARSAADSDGGYAALADATSVVSEDFQTIDQALASGNAVLDDELSTIKGHIAGLVEECAKVSAS